MDDDRAGTGEPVIGPESEPAMRVRRELAEELTDQIALQLVASIRAGRHPAGSRLPSVRRLADLLGVHRETVRGAYLRLGRDGWVRVRQGSGAYVDPTLAPVGFAAGGPVRRLLRRARAEGATALEMAATLERWRESLGRPTVLVVGPDPPTARVWAAELAADLGARGIDVRHAAPDPEATGGSVPSPAGTDGDALPECPFVAAAPPELGSLAAVLPECAELFGLRPGPDPRLRRFFLGLPVGTVVAVVSGSDRVRREVARFGAVLRGGDVAVVEAAPGDDTLARALSVARFVLADVCCREGPIGLSPDRKARCFRHLDPSTARVLADYLGRPPRRSGR